MQTAVDNLALRKTALSAVHASNIPAFVFINDHV